MGKDPTVTPQAVNEHLSDAGPGSRAIPGSNFERFMNELLEEGRKKGRDEVRKEGLEEGRKEGLEEGRKEGLEEVRQEWLRREEELRKGVAETLVTMMSQRFGAVASDHEARIQSADLEQLQKWLRKLGRSSSLGELLEPQA